MRLAPEKFINFINFITFAAFAIFAKFANFERFIRMLSTVMRDRCHSEGRGTSSCVAAVRERPDFRLRAQNGTSLSFVC